MPRDGMTLCPGHVGVGMKCAFLVMSEQFVYMSYVNIRYTCLIRQAGYTIHSSGSRRVHV